MPKPSAAGFCTRPHHDLGRVFHVWKADNRYAVTTVLRKAYAGTLGKFLVVEILAAAQHERFVRERCRVIRFHTFRSITIWSR